MLIFICVVLWQNNCLTATIKWLIYSIFIYIFHNNIFFLVFSLSQHTVQVLYMYDCCPLFLVGFHFFFVWYFFFHTYDHLLWQFEVFCIITIDIFIKTTLPTVSPIYRFFFFEIYSIYVSIIIILFKCCRLFVEIKSNWYMAVDIFAVQFYVFNHFRFDNRRNY